jgi:hypothetical protein
VKWNESIEQAPSRSQRVRCKGKRTQNRHTDFEKELAVTIANASPRRGGRVLELQGEAAQQEMELR